jgi:hypothetical protein
MAKEALIIGRPPANNECLSSVIPCFQAVSLGSWANRGNTLPEVTRSLYTSGARAVRSATVGRYARGRKDKGRRLLTTQGTSSTTVPFRVGLVFPPGSMFRKRGEMDRGLQRQRVGPPGKFGLAGPAPRGPGAAGREGGLLVRLRRPTANAQVSSSSLIPAVCR